MPRPQVSDRARAAEVEGVIEKADVARRSRCCNGSFSAIATERLCPSAAAVHQLRSAQRSHTSASNSTTEPNAMRCTCPVGQAIARSTQGVELTRERRNRRGLRGGIVPVDVEHALEARRQEQGNAGFLAHLRLGPPEQAGRTADHVARGMRE